MKQQDYGHLWNFSLIANALWEAFKMLTPQVQIRNPVMFVTYLGAIATTLCVIMGIRHQSFSWFDLQIALWIWFTVVFANFAQAIAEGRGKAQAAYLRKTQVAAYARKEVGGKEVKVSSKEVSKGDIIICHAGDIIPLDGEVIEGVATVDESAITGESAPVIRESGGDRSAVTAGTKVISDTLRIKVISETGDNFLDKMIHLIEGAKRQKTPNEVALHIVLSGLTLIFLITAVSLKSFAEYTTQVTHQDLSQVITVPILI